MSGILIERLNHPRLLQAVEELCERDPRLATIVKKFGPPPLWDRQPGFPTLVHIILEQQVSLASAQAAFDHLLAAVTPLTPDRFLALDDVRLKEIGFSRQKTRYARALANALLTGALDLEALDSASDEEIRDRLQALPGIGPWTVDIYTLMALGRTDVWPAGDLALATALHGAFNLPSRPSRQEMEELAMEWRPWRAVAARILWHWYLSTRAQNRKETR